MRCYSLVVLIFASYLTFVESSCSQPTKFYVDCSSSLSLLDAVQTCNQYGMSLLNLTNSSSLVSDVAVLNSTLNVVNCTVNFWFASRNTTGYVASLSTLANVLTSLLGGVGLVLGAVLNLLTCILFCPPTTTAPPITIASIVCTRPLQQHVIQKCALTSSQANMRSFHFQQAPMYGGILNSFSASSQTVCSAECCSNSQCTGMSYINGICYLFI